MFQVEVIINLMKSKGMAFQRNSVQEIVYIYCPVRDDVAVVKGKYIV